MKRKSGNTRARTLRSTAHDSDSLIPASRTKAAAICCGIALFFTVAAIAKKKPLTKTIQGEVLNGENNPIVGASVELTDVTTGKTLGIYSEEGGRYHFTDLKPSDEYQVRAAYKGQQSEVRRASALDEEGVRVLNLTIPPPASQ
jgi:hypothetical protein